MMIIRHSRAGFSHIRADYQGRHAAPQPGMAEALVLTGLRLCYIDLYLMLSDAMRLS